MKSCMTIDFGFIDSVDMTVAEIIRRMERRQLVAWDRKYQEAPWTQEQQSRFIESMLMKLPLYPFWFDASHIRSGRWAIIDGLQRLRTVANYTPLGKSDMNIMGKDLPALRGLRYLPELEGMTLAQAPSRYLDHFLNDILIPTSVIQCDAPVDVARDICERWVSEQGLRRHQFFHSKEADPTGSRRKRKGDITVCQTI